MNTENLTILADYLEKLPSDYQEFRMDSFYEALDYLQYIRRGSKCGTVACAVGHGPAAGLTLTAEELGKKAAHTSIWSHYVKLTFGLKWDSPECQWMFGGGWTDTDNTHRGAAARIRFLLDSTQVIPEEFDYDYHFGDLDQYTPLYEGYLV